MYYFCFMQAYIDRPLYLDFLNSWKDEHLIKVVSGVRRCGKSTLFEIFQNHLRKEGISEEQIIHINFEDFTYSALKTPEKLHEYVRNKLKDRLKYYVFLDEIQYVINFEQVVNSLFLDKKIDLYITGSNAYFMSGELATLLSGRYIELKMLPLSFKEFISGRKKGDLRKLFNEYLSTAFPYAINLSREKQQQYLEGIYSTVVLKDIVQRLKVADVATLERLIRYLYAEIGSLQNINKITNTLNSSGNKITNKTVANYVMGMEDALLLYKAERYNVKGRKVLSGNTKYYAVDMGLRRLIAGDRTEDFGHILENIVYLELLRRGYRVYVGVVEKKEVDFLAVSSNNDRMYIQVALHTESLKTLERELDPLRQIKDNYPKYLLTLDDIMSEQNFEGIIKTNVLKWMVDE